MFMKNKVTNSTDMRMKNAKRNTTDLMMMNNMKNSSADLLMMKRNKEHYMYDPHPIDTGTIFLSSELTTLTEEISASIHDVWGRRRMDEGWKWGPCRDDSKRTTPCLIPYEELPESEKDYDRCMVLETIKMIITHGYNIEKRPVSDTASTPPGNL